MSRTLLIILGPTAVGKTDFAIRKALEYGSPVISCDSRQIYKGMSIGTAVPSPEQLAAVRHYFIQTEETDAVYTAGQYEKDAVALIEKLFGEGHETLVMTGGSMMYIDAVTKGFDSLPEGDPAVRSALMDRLAAEGPASLAASLEKVDPETWATIDRSNGHRLVRALEVYQVSGRPMSSFKTGEPRKRDFEVRKIGLSRPRDILYSRIDDRVTGMMEDGLLEEVRGLLPYRDCPALRTVGYREMFKYLDGDCSLDEAVSLVRQHTRNYAKRQMTWWRRDGDIAWKEL